MATKRTFLWLAVALGIVGAGIFLFRGNGSQTTYKGRDVEWWISKVRDSRTVETDKDLRAMMSELGTNALPPLLGAVTKEDRSTAGIYRQMLQRDIPKPLKSFASDQLTKDTIPRYTAATLIPLLPDGGVSAIPALEAHASRTNRPNGSWFSLVALANIGPDAVPALHRLEAGSPAPVKLVVAAYLGANIESGTRIRREKSAVALALFDPTSYSPIPMLDDMSTSRDAATRHEAFTALTNLFPLHVAARDAMKKIASESSDETLREQAKRVIERFYSRPRDSALKP